MENQSKSKILSSQEEIVNQFLTNNNNIRRSLKAANTLREIFNKEWFTQDEFAAKLKISKKEASAIIANMMVFELFKTKISNDHFKQRVYRIKITDDQAIKSYLDEIAFHQANIVLLEEKIAKLKPNDVKQEKANT